MSTLPSVEFAPYGIHIATQHTGQRLIVFVKDDQLQALRYQMSGKNTFTWTPTWGLWLRHPASSAQIKERLLFLLLTALAEARDQQQERFLAPLSTAINLLESF